MNTRAEQLMEYAKIIKDTPYALRTYLQTFDNTQKKYVPMDLFEDQIQLINDYENYNENITRKYRQAGVTTVTAAWLSKKLQLAKPDNPERVLLIANKRDTAVEMANKVRHFIEQWPDWINVGFSPDKNSESRFRLNNGCEVKAVATSADALRGYTPTILVFDEAAYIEAGDDFWAASMASLSTGGKIILISTPNGYDPIYYGVYDQALRGINDFHITDLRWFKDPRYTKDLHWVKCQDICHYMLNREQYNDDEVVLHDFDIEKYQELVEQGYKPFSSWFESMSKKFKYDRRKIAQELECDFLGSGDGVIPGDIQENIAKNMIRIPKNTASMYIVGLEQEAGKQVGEFLIDRFEVTNKQFKEFIDADGYTNASFWNYPFYSNGQELSLEDAIAKFIDKTGRRGPANWEAGTYPDGLENHPVTGISWYEAAAYASYAKKQLPSVFHWSVVAQTSRTEFIVPLSNYSGKSTVPVGSMSGYSLFGVYDLAGNAREWCFNESNRKGQRYILGGGWNDPTYAFNDSYTQSAMDRSSSNGFRCIKTLPADTTITQLMGTVSTLFRDYRKEKPVDDKTFALYLNQFLYDKIPLESKVELTLDKDLWKIEKVTFDAGYNNERMQAWIYLPKEATPPYQPIIFFTGSGDIYRKVFDPDRIGSLDFILKSGRVLIFPIYKGTNERHDELNSDLQEETVLYKDHVIMWGKEFRRTIDYLETRADIQADKIGYLGWSWGGFMGGIIPAVEKRIKAIVLNVGGMEMNRAFPEVDQLNYLPRVTQPILMLNGKHDMFFPVETSQKPMYDLLGTPSNLKKKIVYDAGHLVPRTDFVKETLVWFDQYLGPVK